MITLLKILLETSALFLFVPVCVFFVEILLAVSNLARESPLAGERGRLVVLMPAHNESAVIAYSLRSIVPQLTEPDRVLVVADNCADDTVAIARAEGAQVVERSDLARRGKGYALDFGIRHLELDPPDTVIIIDADCRVAPGAIDTLARRCTIAKRPVQALYLMHAAKNAGLNMRIAEFAWIVKNEVRPTGLNRLGLPCQLMGTGMAFPWQCIHGARLATGHIVEDLKLGIDLARSGKAPLFCSDALVSSEFPASGDGIQGQRTRWEHGHLGVIVSEVPRLLWSSVTQRSIELMAITLDLSVPPLALLTLLVAASWCASAIYFAVTRMAVPLGLASAVAVMLVVSVLAAWLRYGRRIISLASLALAIIYALWKIPLYAKFLVARQLDWVRSKRDGDGS